MPDSNSRLSHYQLPIFTQAARISGHWVDKVTTDTIKLLSVIITTHEATSTPMGINTEVLMETQEDQAAKIGHLTQTNSVTVK